MMAVQPDGKILLVGGHEYRGPGTVVRFNPNGSLDSTFGEGGILRDKRFTNGLSTVAVLANGDVAVGGGTGRLYENYVPTPTVARYLPDGQIDTSFGPDGTASNLGVGMPTALVPKADGSLIVGATQWQRAGLRPYPIGSVYGSAWLVSPSGGTHELVGQIPDLYAEGFSHYSSVASLLAEPDGSLIAGGLRAGKAPRSGLVLARFLPGSGLNYDPSFAAGEGLLTPEIGALPVYASDGSQYFISKGSRPALSADQGKILVASEEVGSLSETPLLMRFSEEGALDPSFGEGGLLRPKLPGAPRAEATAVAVQSDGKIIAALRTNPPREGVNPEESGVQEAFVARFMPNGELDPTFGNDGVSHIAPNGDETYAMAAEDLAIQPDGTILVGGRAPRSETLLAARLNEGGQLESSFGENGIASATPCPGPRCGAEVTHSSLRLRNRSGPAQPALRLHLQMKGPPSWTISAVKITLPGPLHFRPRLISGVWAVPLSSTMRETANARSASILNLDAETLTLGLRDGLLKRVQRIGPKRPLTFHIQVEFSGCPCELPGDSGSTQDLVLRVRGGHESHA